MVKTKDATSLHSCKDRNGRSIYPGDKVRIVRNLSNIRHFINLDEIVTFHSVSYRFSEPVLVCLVDKNQVGHYVSPHNCDGTLLTPSGRYVSSKEIELVYPEDEEDLYV